MYPFLSLPLEDEFLRVNSEFKDFPHSAVGKESTCNAGDPGSIPGWGRSPWRRNRLPTPIFLGFPCGSTGKEPACNVRDLGSIPGLGRSPGEGKGYPFQYSGLENSQRVGHDWATFTEFKDIEDLIDSQLGLQKDGKMVPAGPPGCSVTHCLSRPGHQVIFSDSDTCYFLTLFFFSLGCETCVGS